MIGRQDILDRAAEWQLRPEIVEKDYVLGWLLAAIAQHPLTSTAWVFKGGTCLKKCFFETYRFSEDLDFTLLPGATYQEPEIRMILQEMSRQASELSGIEFPEGAVLVRPRRDTRGRPTFEARVSYRGPLPWPGSPPRIQLDLTQHEPVLEPVARRPIYHPYPDGLPEETRLGTYSLEELLAEKTRALLERTRPRDLYDVVYVLENLPHALQMASARRLFTKKCEAKGLVRPTAPELVALARGSAELRADWENMLAHQLPQLPPIDGALERLPRLLAFLEAPAPIPGQTLSPVPARRGEAVVAPHGGQFWNAGVPLEVVRFAGANRLLIEFNYQGRLRRAEPYSLRRPKTGNLLLYAWEQEAGSIKAFKVSEVRDLRATQISFVPRFRIEFSFPRSRP